MPRTRAVLVIGLLALTGCSALSGKDAREPTIHAAPSAGAGSSAGATDGPQFSSPATVAQVLAAGRQGFETIYTYDYRNLPRYLAAGRAVTTAPMTAQYAKLLTGDGAKQLRALKQVQDGQADHVGLAGLSGPSAAVLVNGRLTTSASGSTTPTTKNVTVALQLRLIGGRWRVRSLAESGAASGTVPGNAALSSAIAGARADVTAVLTLRRARFASDFANALDHTTGSFRSDLRSSEAGQRKTLTAGGYDLTARILGLGVVRVDDSSVQFVAAIDQFHIGRQGARFGPYPLDLTVTATRVGDRWLLGSVTTLS